LPPWLKEPENVRQSAREAVVFCKEHGSSLAKLALQFSVANPAIATTVAGSANPKNIRQWAEWLREPLDQELLQAVIEKFSAVKNIGHSEGLVENN
ncbi:MAG: aldo/keto reductase, partial [Planctomycetaceae bacterium]|nr:aldo/keto reductase [Planctomycetaceae bacterium]